MHRVLVAWDAEDFGGHDLSALVALKSLLKVSSLKVGVFHTGRNPRLENALAREPFLSGKLEVITASPPSALSECLDGLICGRRTRAVSKVIRDWKPDLILNVQGFITLGLCVLSAARSLNIPVISYLPMTHRVWTLYHTPLSLLQDRINRFWYGLPGAIIVTSHRMKEKLLSEHQVDPRKIAVVEYGPDLTQLKKGERETARQNFQLDAKICIALIGRVEFRQKNQNFLLKAIHKHRLDLTNFHFLMVGDGPDLDRAKRESRDSGIADKVQFVPWLEEMSDLYAAIDGVVIPSRFEGVPLVMLEAMALRIPVIATDTDGMSDYLPPEFLFPPDDDAKMIKVLLEVFSSPKTDILDHLEQQIRTRVNAETFSEKFQEQVIHFVEGLPS